MAKEIDKYLMSIPKGDDLKPISASEYTVATDIMRHSVISALEKKSFYADKTTGISHTHVPKATIGKIQFLKITLQRPCASAWYICSKVVCEIIKETFR